MSTTNITRRAALAGAAAIPVAALPALPALAEGDLDEQITALCNELARVLKLRYPDEPWEDETPLLDAELLALGEALKREWAAERAVLRDVEHWADGFAADEVVNAAMDVCGAIVERIINIPAATHAGIQVKLLGIAWCHNGEPVELEEFGYATSSQLAGSIVRDLAAMAGRAA